MAPGHRPATSSPPAGGHSQAGRLLPSPPRQCWWLSSFPLECTTYAAHFLSNLGLRDTSKLVLTGCGTLPWELPHAHTGQAPCISSQPACCACSPPWSGCPVPGLAASSLSPIPEDPACLLRFGVPRLNPFLLSLPQLAHTLTTSLFTFCQGLSWAHSTWPHRYFSASPSTCLTSLSPCGNHGTLPFLLCAGQMHVAVQTQELFFNCAAVHVA